MKNVTSIILSLCLSFSLIVPFSFSVNADDIPTSEDIPLEIFQSFSSNFDFTRSSSIFFKDTNDIYYFAYLDSFYYYNNRWYISSSEVYSISSDGVITRSSNFVDRGISVNNSYFWFKLDNKIYIDLIFGYSFSNFGDVPFKYSSVSSNLVQQAKIVDSYQISGGGIGGIITGTNTNNANNYTFYCYPASGTGTGAELSCEWRQPNTSSSVNNSLSGTMNGDLIASGITTTNIYQNSQTILFDDYYSGSITLPSSIYFSGGVDGGIWDHTDLTFTFTDSNHLTVYWYSVGSPSSGSIPQPSYYTMFKSNSFLGLYQSLDSIFNELRNFGSHSDDLVQSSDDLKNQDQKLGSSINEYDQLESEFIDQSSEAMDKVDTSNPLFGVQSFVNTAQWVSARVTDVYESNSYIGYLVVFGLITGLSLFVVGRRWR